MPVSFTAPSYCGWIKFSSHTNRTWFDHDGLLQVKTNSAGQIQLVINGSTYSGSTTLPLNTWIFWGFKRSTANLHTLQTRYVQLIDTTYSLTTAVVEVNVTQTPSGSPTEFTVHIPAGCSICGFRYGGSSANLLNGSSSWGVGSSSIYIWQTPLRFPNDLYDHREISATNGDTTFTGMHKWTSQTGTVTLDANDPETLLATICSAVLGIETYDPDLEVTHDDVPPSSPDVNNSLEPDFTIRTDVLPSNADLNGLKIGAYAYHGSGNFAANPSSLWYFDADPTAYGPYGVGDHYGHYDWSHMGTPSTETDNPSTGQAWTLDDLYNARFDIVATWSPLIGGGVCRTYFVHDLGLSCLYTGGGGISIPTPTGGVIGPLVWWHKRRRVPT